MIVEDPVELLEAGDDGGGVLRGGGPAGHPATKPYIEHRAFIAALPRL